MNRPHQRVNQGVRSNRYSGSKLTNWTRFDPWTGEVNKLYDSRFADLPADRPEPRIVIQEPHEAFVRPVDEDDLREALARVPAEFRRGLVAISVLAGSAKQAKTLRLFCYGWYGSGCIFLAPFPRRWLSRRHRRAPKPSVLHGYRRAGASVRWTRAGVQVDFDRAALRRFYLQDVLMHEIGHHVDRRLDRDRRSCERFANWFATEHGFRLRVRTGPGPVSWGVLR